MKMMWKDLPRWRRLDSEAAAAFAKEVNVGQNIDIASDGDVYNDPADWF